jgi:hypothetical protein
MLFSEKKGTTAHRLVSIHISFKMTRDVVVKSNDIDELRLRKGGVCLRYYVTYKYAL